MSPISVSTMQRDRITGLTASFFLHIFLFVCGGLVLIKPVEYAVEAGSGGIEVSLTAAPAETLLTDQIVSEQPKPSDEEVISHEPENTPLLQDQIEELRPETSADPLTKVDGSSPIFGKDATTYDS